MTKKQWSDKFEKDNGRKPNERELKVAKQSDYKIKTDIKLIKETKLVRKTSSAKKTTSSTKAAPKKTVSKSTAAKKTTTKKTTPKKTTKKASEKTITLEDLGGTTTKVSTNKGLKVAIPIIGSVLILLFAIVLIINGNGKDKSAFYANAPEIKSAIKEGMETGVDDIEDLKVSNVKIKLDESTKNDEEPKYKGTAHVTFSQYDYDFDMDVPYEGKLTFTVTDTKDVKSDKDSFYLLIEDLE